MKLKKQFLYFSRKIYHDYLKSYYLRLAIYKTYQLFFVKFNKNLKKKYYFPYSISGNINYISRPMFIDKNGFGYYTQFYNETFLFKSIEKGYLYQYPIEIFHAKKYLPRKDKVANFTISNDCIIPISIINRKAFNSIGNNFFVDLFINKKKSRLSNLSQNRFHYLKFRKNEQVSIASESELLIGKPIDLNETKKRTKKVVLCIFIDAFSWDLFKKGDFKKYLPNTYNFFKKGVIFKNCFANGESTLTSLSSIFTGKYVSRNNFFHPRREQVIGIEQEIMPQFFQKAGFYTQLISGNYGQNPSQGYCLGFDRILYKHSMRHNQIVDEFLSSLEIFKERSIFSFLSFLDIHHNLGINSHFGNAEIDISGHNYETNDRIKSPFRGFSESDKVRYLSEISRLDNSLQRIFEKLESSYTDDEILVTLFSDHGNSSVDYSSDKSILRKSKLNVPLMFRGVNHIKDECETFVENVDILPSLLNFSDINYNDKEFDGKLPDIFGGVKKEFVFSESLYPNQFYKATLKCPKEEAFIHSNDYVDQHGNFDSSQLNLEIFNFGKRKKITDSVKQKFYLDKFKKILKDVGKC